MRKLSIKFLSILFFLLLCSILSAQTNTLNNNNNMESKFISEEKKNVLNYKIDKLIAISPLISLRVCVGIITAKQNSEQHWIEYKYYLHGFYSEGLRTYGAAVTYNYFWSGTRKGYFTQFTAGIDYVYFTGFGFGPATGGGGEGFGPSLSSGFGYSFQLGKDSYLRLNMDIGIKWFLSNIYISYVW